MKLMEILEEGISDIVYHATDIIKAANILQKKPISFASCIC